MTFPRLSIHLFSFLFFIFLAEFSARHFLSGAPPQNFENFYRFPENSEHLFLPELVGHIKNAAAPKQRRSIIIFSGSSPTYGHKIKDARNTYPFAFAKCLTKLKNPHAENTLIYNTASDGQLVSDQYYIIKSLIHAGDFFFIQLNYHTFNPRTLRETVIRHKEMPEMLGVPVTASEAAILNRRPSPFFSLNTHLQYTLKKHSALYREREMFAERLFKGKPEDAIYRLYEKMRGKESTKNDAAITESTLPFSALKPAQQMVIVKRYSERCEFNIEESNSEIFFLKEMMALLKKGKKHAVFFITPLNREALDAYEVMDWKKYNKNADFIARLVTQNSFLFLDFNKKHYYSENLFFDISHMLDTGGKIVGKDLFFDTKAELEKTL